MNTLIEHLRIFIRTLKQLLLTTGTSWLNVLVIGIALSLPVGGYVLLKTVQALGTNVAGTSQLSVFMATSATSAEVERTGTKLRNHASIKQVEFVSRTAALKQLQRNAMLSDVVDSLTHNPLPDAYILYPARDDITALETLRDELKAWPQVAHVQLDSAWVYKLKALLDFGRWSVAILAALLSFALIAITFNTIRLQILTRREEIEVAKLIGATDAFIRRPFLYFGLTQGLLGGAVAWLLVAGSLFVLNHQLAVLSQLYTNSLTLQHLSLGDSVTLLLFSAYLGWLGAWFSVSQHLWQIEPR